MGTAKHVACRGARDRLPRVQPEPSLEPQHAAQGILEPLPWDLAAFDRGMDAGDVGIRHPGEQDHVPAALDDLHLALPRIDPGCQARHLGGIRDDDAVEAQPLAQQFTIERAAERRRSVGLEPGLRVQFSDEGRQRDMARHDRQDAGADRAAIEPPERLFPLLHGQRIDRRQQMLIAIVEAFARPMLGGGGETRPLQLLDVGEGVTLDAIDVAAEAARGDDGAAEGGVDVDNRRERPVDPERRRFERNDARDRAGRIDVVHRSQGQRICHRRAKGKAEPRPLQVGADKRWHPRRLEHTLREVEFVLEVAAVVARNPASLQPAHVRQRLARIFPGQQDEELRHLLPEIERGGRVAYPADVVAAEAERWCGKMVELHSRL